MSGWRLGRFWRVQSAPILFGEAWKPQSPTDNAPFQSGRAVFVGLVFEVSLSCVVQKWVSGFRIAQCNSVVLVHKLSEKPFEAIENRYGRGVL